MKKRFWVIILMLIFLLSACGGANSPATDIKVTLTDFMFSPNQFTVPAGMEITLEINNSGGVIHNFIIMNLGETAGTEFTKDDNVNVYWMTELSSGSSNTITFTAPSEPGNYEVVCGIPGHLQAGMVATMTVVAGE